MDEAVDAFLDADEHAEFGDVLDSAFEDGALGVLLGHDIPRFGEICFMPREMRFLSGSTPSTMTSTSSPTFTIWEG